MPNVFGIDLTFIIVLTVLLVWGIFEVVRAFRKARHDKMKTDKLLGVWKGNDEGQGPPAPPSR